MKTKRQIWLFAIIKNSKGEAKEVHQQSLYTARMVVKYPLAFVIFDANIFEELWNNVRKGVN